MTILGEFRLMDYSTANGIFRLHFVNDNPGGGNASDYFLDVPEAELPANINQNQLATMLKQRLGWTVNQTFAPLNAFIAAGSPVVLP